MPESCDRPPLPFLPALIVRAGRSVIARPRELLIIALAFGSLAAVNDMFYGAALDSLRERILSTAVGAGGGFSHGASVYLGERLPMQLATLLGPEEQSFARTLSLRFTFLTAPFDLFHAVALSLLLLSAALCFLSLFLHRSALRETSDVLSTRLLPLLWFCALFVLRTFLWVPLIGILLGQFLFAEYGETLIALEMTGFVIFLSLAPRYALAPLFIVEGETPLRSMRRSEEQTRGYRWECIANLSLIVLPLTGLCILLSYLLPASFAFSQVLLPIITALLTQAVLIAGVAVYVELGKTVTETSVPSALAVLATQERGQLKKPSPVNTGGDADDLPEHVGLEGGSTNQPAIHPSLRSGQASTAGIT